MKVELEFPEFHTLKTQMGAQESLWRPASPTLKERETLIAELAEGKEIPLAEVKPDFGGLLTHRGEQVVLYIKDTRQDRHTLLHDIRNSRRFHVFECRTLDGMRKAGRFERYVVTTRKDGRFLVEATDPMDGSVEEIEAPLAVCMNCLTKLEWKGWINLEKTRDVWENFSLQDFFAEFATFFASKPQHSDKTAPRGGYAQDWHHQAAKIKQQRNWRCDKCGVNLSDDRSLLHGHHKNGVVSDNRPSNIDALCLLCHSEQPAHEWMTPSPTDRFKIEALRLKQLTP
ncbi:MAG: hypothetical protein OXC69_04535 [Candidatus Tectomicrobia bacterium]|nr:hypothetical protein [Candidatus Tectomicrobia bacterium]